MLCNKNDIMFRVRIEFGLPVFCAGERGDRARRLQPCLTMGEVTTPLTAFRLRALVLEATMLEEQTIAASLATAYQNHLLTCPPGFDIYQRKHFASLRHDGTDASDPKVHRVSRFGALFSY